MRGSSEHVWGTTAVALGLWELAAAATGRLPTVSTAVASCRSRRRRSTLVGVGVWTAALAWHLATHPGRDGRRA